MKFVLSTALLGLALTLSACQPADKAPAAEQKTAEATAKEPTLAQAQAAAEKTAAAVKADNPYVRAVPPGQENSAAFMTLTNSSDVPVALIAAESPVADKVELHEHTNNNGVMAMRQIPQIEVPAKGSVELKPGGLHIMLIGLKQALNAGGNVPLTLLFADGGLVQVTAPIKTVDAPMAGAAMGKKPAK